MPIEKFYVTGQVENDGRSPDFQVGWTKRGQQVQLIVTTPDGMSGIVTFNDRSALDRLNIALRRAERQAFGDEVLPGVIDFGDAPSGPAGTVEVGLIE